MAKPFSDQLRRELLQAYDRGEGTLDRLARRFSVSPAWARKISAQRKRSGLIERVAQQRGKRSKMTFDVEQAIRSWVQVQPDITLAEIQYRLKDVAELPVSIGRLSEVRRELGLRPEKVLPAHSDQLRPTE